MVKSLLGYGFPCAVLVTLAEGSLLSHSYVLLFAL